MYLFCSCYFWVCGGFKDSLFKQLLHHLLFSSLQQHFFFFFSDHGTEDHQGRDSGQGTNQLFGKSISNDQNLQR